MPAASTRRAPAAFRRPIAWKFRHVADRPDPAGRTRERRRIRRPPYRPRCLRRSPHAERHRRRVARGADLGAGAGEHPARAGDGDPRRGHRGEGAGRAEGDGRQEQGPEELHRPGLLRHDHAGRHPAQHPREPGLVHRLHALPGRDLARPHGSAAELPDPGHRPHRHGHRQRVDAGRGHRGRRGDDAGAAHGQEQEQGLLRRRRRAAADAGSGAHARPPDRRRGAGRRGGPGGPPTRTASPPCSSTPASPARCAC
jgi:hypothetical protein